MKKFDLQRYKSGDSVKTVDGKNVLEIHESTTLDKLLVLLDDSDSIHVYNLDGTKNGFPNLTLVIGPLKKWFVVHPRYMVNFPEQLKHDSKEEAEKFLGDMGFCCKEWKIVEVNFDE